jgi:hypothetical protein
MEESICGTTRKIKKKKQKKQKEREATQCFSPSCG